MPSRPARPPQQQLPVDADEPERADATTRQFYEENAHAYAEQTLQADLRPLWTTFERLVRPGARIADLGSGAGRELRHFSKAFRPIGLDLSYALSRIAREISHVPVVVGDLVALPFSSNAFDAVWSSAAILHLSEARAGSALAEIHRVLQPGGIALMTFKEGHGSVMDAHGRRTTLYSRASADRALSAAGLLSVEVIRTVENRDGEEIPWLAYFTRRP